MKIGEKIEDRYIIQQQLGPETYIVMNLLSGIKWILKALPSLDKDDILKFLQKIRHPALPRIFETFEIEQKPYYLLEYIEGPTLLELCEKHGGKIPFLNACDYMARISRTLYFLHSQNAMTLLHLDIKPGNIILSKNSLPCLIDYGSLKILTTVQPQEDGIHRSMIFGTPGYAPPEMMEGKAPMEQSDIYMVGMTLYRLITGQEPDMSIQSDSRQWTSTVPAIVARTIQKCTMNRPEDRYGNASELACDLETACNTTLSYDTFPNKEFSKTALLQESLTDMPYHPGYKKVLDDPDRFCEKKHISRNRILCIWNNSQFAVELSSVIAKQGKKVLIIDADLLAPGVDLLLEIKDSQSKASKAIFSNNGLADLMEEFARNRISSETIRMFAQKTSIEGLYCLCGDYRMEDYEYYSTDGLVEIIKTASSGFDHVIVSCGKFIYDEFTCAAQISANRVIIPITANSMQFREFNRYINFLTGRKQLEREKIIFVAFDYMSSEDLSFGTCDELCDGLFFGTVSYSSKRRMLQGTKKPYVNVMESKIEKQYLGILKKAAILAP